MYCPNRQLCHIPSISETINHCHNALFGNVACCQNVTMSWLTSLSTAKSTYMYPYADHQAASGIAVPVILVTDGLTRSGMTTAYHLRISGGALSVMVTAEPCYAVPCWLSIDNNKKSCCSNFKSFFLESLALTLSVVISAK